MQARVGLSHSLVVLRAKGLSDTRTFWSYTRAQLTLWKCSDCLYQMLSGYVHLCHGHQLSELYNWPDKKASILQS